MGIEETSGRAVELGWGRGAGGEVAGLDESLKVTRSNVATVLGPLVPLSIRIQRHGKGGKLISHLI